MTIEKAASTALARRLRSENDLANRTGQVRGVKIDGNLGAGNGMKATKGVREAGGNLQAANRANLANANRPGSSQLNRIFGDSRVDPLSKPVSQRLAEFKKEHNIPDASDGHAVANNVQSIRDTGRKFQSQVARTQPNSSAPAAQHLNQTLAASKNGPAAVTLNKDATGFAAKFSSTSPAKAVKPEGLLSRARGLIGKITPKHMAIAGGVALGGLAAKSLMHKKSNPDEYIPY